MDIARPSNNLLIRHATSIAIAAVTVLVLLAVMMFRQQSLANEEARGWVAHTYIVRHHIQALHSGLQDAVLGCRGYLVDGNTSLLEPYETAMKDGAGSRIDDAFVDQHRSIRQEMAMIRSLTVDNAAQQSNWDELEGGVKELIEYLSAAVQKRRDASSGINQSAVADLDIHREKEMMDHLRALLRIMTAEEGHLLTLRTEVDESIAKANNRLTFIAIGFFYIAITFSIWLYQRSRSRAQAQMIRYMQELERNEEELKQQQEELKASNEEIEASNEEMKEKAAELEEQNSQIQRQAQDLEESQRLIEEKAREIERASKYKSEFLANMSHELRTPLNSLLILARLLASNEDGNLTEEQIEEARVIHNGGLELLSLINDILDLSKVEAGKLSLTIEDIALDGIVKRMQQQFAPVAKEKAVAFPVKMAANLPELLRTDAQRVEQILKNLLSNAFKFTEHGSVTLEIRGPEKEELQRSSLGFQNAIAFSVIDTGIGIEPSKFKDIFEAFQQEDGSIDRNYGGTGLGLTIARKFAHMLGGEIHVASAKGQGSRFTLILPARLAQNGVKESDGPITAAAPESSRIELKTMPKTWVAEFIADDRKNISDRDKVLLIVEDDAVFASTLMKLARKRGYKCLAAGDGKSGLLLAAAEPVTAIILDLKLPDIDGMSVLEQLKHDLKTRHIPVHIISGRSDADILLPLRKGAIGYLAKPVDKEAIEGAFCKIEALLQSEVKQVLLVEDDVNSQTAVRKLLMRKDVNITVAGTGQSATEHVGNTRFDCIILDLQLPDMNGFEWLEQMEAGKSTIGLPPVIVYTARELSEDENRKLNRFTGSIIIKGAKSPERLLDEVTLFLHSLESTLSVDQQDLIRMQHNPDEVLKGRTILLTDDDLRNTFALSKLLKSHGMNVVIADNGQMALEKLATDKSIELVIMDIMMPVMDGYQTMHRIREQEEYAELPIIALTARAMPEEQEKCMEAGANDYLTKPVDIERLLTLLRVWLFQQEVCV